MQEDNPQAGLREAVAEILRVEMARRRMTQRKLADATGLSQSYIGRRMTGEMPFTTDDLHKIAGVLGMPVSALIPNDAAALAAT
jgi:transcriptional regulator with XRE-family HTH domain